MRRQHLCALLIFAAVLAVVFYRAIFSGEILAPLDLLPKELPWRGVVPAETRLGNPALADVTAIFHPWKKFVHDELRAGRFPLWCTHVGCGYPLAGAGDLKLFGVTTLFLAVLPVAVATWLSFFTQLLIAMAGMYVLLLVLRCRWVAAVFGGLVFGLNSAMIQHLQFEHVVGGLMLLPWVCWALLRSVGDRRFVLLAGVLLGLVLLNGSVQSFVMVWVSSAAFAGVVLRRHAVVAVGVATVVGLAVGAVALWPNLELITRNVRTRYEQIDWASMMWKRPVAVGAWFAALFNPDVLGNAQTFDLTRALGQVGMAGRSASVIDLRIYGGLVAALLAVLGLRGRRAERTVALWMIGVPLVMVAILPVYLLVYFRYLAATALGLSILAALGLERLLAGDSELRDDLRRLLLTLAGGVAVAVVVGAVVTSRQEFLTDKVRQAGAQGTSFYRADKDLIAEKANATVVNFSWRGGAVARFAVVAVAAGVLLVGYRRWPAVGVCCLVLNAADCADVAWRSMPAVPARLDYPSTPALDFLQRQPGLFRVMSGWNFETEFPTARPNFLLPYRLNDVRVYESLVPKNPLVARGDWENLNVRFFIKPPTGSPPGNDWRLVYQGEVNIYENPQVRPRVELPGGQVQVEKYVSGCIQLRTESAAPATLVVRERAYPGWVARVDGQRVAWREVDELWMAVPVAAGAHAVTLDYQPVSVRWGGILTAITLLAVGVTCRINRSATARIVPA